MFSDPLTAVMTMLILFFLGLLVMFLFILRALSALADEARESFRKQQMFLADLERQFMEMHFTLRRMQGEGAGDMREAGQGGGEMPILRQDDDLLSMLETAARKRPAISPLDDQLLPPAPAARAASRDFDPADDQRLLEEALLGGAPAYRPRNVTAARPSGAVRAGNAGRRVPLSLLDE